MISPIATLPGYIEVVEDQPATLTVPATARQIYQGLAVKWVTAYLIRVRSMGTATYIRLGNSAAQEYTLKAVGDVRSFACNPGEVVDMCNVWVKSDTADAVIEISCSYVPVKRDGNVVIADGDL